MAGLQDISAALTRAGERGLGTFERNEAARKADKKASDLDRAQATARDGISLLDKLNRDDIGGFNKKITARLLFQMGTKDPSASETLELGQRVKDGDIEGAKQELQSFAREAQLAGFLPQNDPLVQQVLGVKPKIDQQQVNALRGSIKDFNKDFRQVEAAFGRIQKVGRKGTAASDLSLIFNFMKINDPGSTVREGEFATAQQTTGVPGRIVSLYNNLLKGTRLTQEQRDDFLDTAEGLVEGQRTATDNQIENVLQQSDQDQIPRDRVIGKERLAEFEARRAETPAAPDLSDISVEQLRAMSDEDLQALLSGQ